VEIARRTRLSPAAVIKAVRPDYLARRLAATPGSRIQGVGNEGISGNMVLTDGAGLSAIKRLHRDVLSQPGVRTVFEGINDIKAHEGVTARI
jgi:lysophospholipase L1-like esterase